MEVMFMKLIKKKSWFKVQLQEYVQIMAFQIQIMILVLITFVITSCGGGRKSGSPSAAGNAILPSAPKLDPPAVVYPPSTSYPSNVTQLNIAGTCTPGPGAKVFLGGDENKTVECSTDGDFNFIVTASNDGVFNYTLHMESLTQHPSDEIPLTWLRSSTTPAAPTITSPGTQPYLSGGSSLDIVGRCTAGGYVSVTGDSTQTTTCDSSGAYSFTISKSVDGIYLFDIFQVDQFGNTSPEVEISWTRNTAVPSTPVISSPAANPYTSSDSIITLVGTCVGGSTIRVNKLVSSVEELVGTSSCTSGTFTFDITENLDGTYDYNISSYSVTNVSSAVSTFQWIRNSSVPNTPILSSPATPTLSTNTNSITIAGSCDDGNTVYLNGDSSSSIACSSSSFSFNVIKNTDSTYNFTVYQKTPGNIQSGATSITWIRDTLAPIAPILTAPGITPYYSASNNLLISGVCENDSNVIVSGDSSIMVVCSGSSFSFNLSKTTNNTYSFSVTQTDAAGNNSSATNLVWVLDTVAPGAPTVTSPASYPILTNTSSITISGTCENNATVYLIGSSTQNVTCSSTTYSFTVNQSTDNIYDFSVYQTDLAGSSSASTVARWIRDTGAPSAPVITNPSISPYTSSDTNLTISGTCESGSTINYSNAASGTTTCSTSAFSFSITKSVDGNYTIDITQTDGAGNTSGIVSLNWIRNTSIPSTPSITTPASSPYFGKVASITLSGSCSSGNTVQISGASSQSTTCSSNAFSFSLSQSTDGTYNYSIVQINGSSISSGAATFSWILDRVSPTNPVISSPASGVAYNSASSLTISGSCEANATIQYSGNATGTTSCSAGNSFSFSVNSSTDGILFYSINQVDQAGNISGTNSVTWHRDTLAPNAPSITQPNMNPFASGDTNITIAGNCEPNATVNLTGALVQSMTCTSLSTYSFNVSKTLDGTYNFSLNQTDLASNVSSTQSFQWLRDTTYPFTPIITSPGTINYYSNGSSVSVSVTCISDLTPLPAIVHLSGVLDTEVLSPSNTLDQDCTSSPVTFVISKSLDDTYHFNFSQENPNNGNSSATTVFNWTRDTVAPIAPTVTSPSSTPYTGPGNLTLAGACETNSTVNVSGDATQSQTCVAGLYSFTINKSTDSTYTFNIAQTDFAGNTSSSTTQSWTRNSSSLPPPTITSPISTPYSSNSSNLTISGDCQPDYTITLAGDISASEVTSPSNSLTQVCTSSGNYSFTFGKSTDGTFNLNLTASYNSATSAATNFVWIKDTVAPAASISTTANNPNLGTTITFSFSANESATYQCKLNSSAYQSCSASTNYSGLTNGSNTVYLKATDSVGNIGSEVTYTWTQAAYNAVALYHMEAGTGSALNDSGLFTSTAAFNNNLTSSGSPTTNTSGKLPTSAPKSFKLGTSKYLSATSNNSLNSVNQKMTVEGLFSFSSLPSSTGNYYTLFSKMGSSGNYGWEIRLRKASSSKYAIDFVGSLNGTSTTTKSSSTFSLSTSTWYHIYVTWNMGTINFYLGSSGSTTARSSGVIGTAGTSVLFANTAALKIGANATSATSGTSRWLNGSVDEVRISNIIRTDTATPSFPASEFTAD